MSHVAKIKLKVTNLEALRKAATFCGLELVEQGTYKWYGTSVGDYPLPAGFTKKDLGKCDYALRIPGDKNAYEIGVVRAKDGSNSFELLWDFWSGGFGLEAKVGKDAIKLQMEYATQMGILDMQQQGYVAEREEDAETGELLIAVTAY
jgi:hypothetical protein